MPEIRESSRVRAVRRSLALTLLALLASATAAPAQEPSSEEPPPELGLASAPNDALDTAKRTGVFLLSTDHAFAVVGSDLVTIATALLDARAASLATFLRVAVDHQLAASVEPGRHDALGALLMASALAGNELPNQRLPEALRAALDAENYGGFLSLPEGFLASMQPKGVFRDRVTLRGLFQASAYLRVASSPDNPNARALLRHLLRDEAMQGAVDDLRHHHAITRHLFGPGTPHLFDDDDGSMVPRVAAPDDLLGEARWMFDERRLLDTVGAEHACTWLGRVFAAEACEGLGWPATRAHARRPVDTTASARAWLVHACAENARRRELPSLLAHEGEHGWARRRLVASTALYATLRGLDAIDLPRGPLTGVRPAPPPPRITWLIEPLPEVFEALARAYAEMEYCSNALGHPLNLLGSSRAFELLAGCARAEPGSLSIDQAALLRGFAERSADGRDVCPAWLRLSERASIRAGALRAEEVQLDVQGRPQRAGTCRWSLLALQRGRPVEQTFGAAWAEIAR